MNDFWRLAPYYYNLFEGVLWASFSLFFLIPALKPGEKHRGFCLFGVFAFVTASLSEFYEAHTGAWWKPWWLIIWKASFGLFFAIILYWYWKIDPGFKRLKSKKSSTPDNQPNKELKKAPSD